MVLIFLLVLFCSPSCAESPKVFQAIRLDAFRPDPRGCAVKWTTYENQMVWVDNDHLATWLVYFCFTPDSKDRKSRTELAIFDLKGNPHSSSSWTGFGFGFLPGPSGTLLIGHTDHAEILDSKLRTQETLKCPVEDVPCAIFAPPLQSVSSEFALCSYTTVAENCAFYRGFPSEKLSEKKLKEVPSRGLPIDPYTGMASSSAPTSLYGRTGWKVSASEFWYFDYHGRLTRTDSGEPPMPVSVAKWTPNDSSCTGELSDSEPRRFLATCVGAHVYTDGELDALFGYSRIALFDVA